MASAFRVARALPADVACEMLLTGHDLDAARGERLGFVNVLTEPGQALAGAEALADEICTVSPIGARAGLAISNLVTRGDETELRDQSGTTHEVLLRTSDSA
jgi:enoyl-CoA hydratase